MDDDRDSHESLAAFVKDSTPDDVVLLSGGSGFRVCHRPSARRHRIEDGRQEEDSSH